MSSNSAVGAFAVLAVGCIFGIGSCTYQHTTVENRSFTVDDKWTKRNGESDLYLISTTNGDVLQNSDSLFHGKWNSSDIYARIQPGDRCTARTAGLRMQFFSAYPNILEVNCTRPDPSQGQQSQNGMSYRN